MKKAYDIVPHKALFAKLWCFGIRGRAYDFIVGLYRKSTIRVRLGHGTGAVFTEQLHLLCSGGSARDALYHASCSTFLSMIYFTTYSTLAL